MIYYNSKLNTASALYFSIWGQAPQPFHSSNSEDDKVLIHFLLFCHTFSYFKLCFNSDNITEGFTATYYNSFGYQLICGLLSSLID